MPAAEFDRLELAGQQGLDRLCRGLVLTAEAPDRFRATLLSATVDDIRFHDVAISPHRATRTPSLVEDVPSDLLHLHCVLAGEVLAAQDGRWAVARAGQLVALRTSGVFELSVPDNANVVSLVVPAHDLQREAAELPSLTAQTLADTPLVRALTKFITSLTAGTPEPGSEAARFAARAIADLTRAAISEFVDGGLDPESLDAGTRIRVREYIDTHLTQPGLNALDIASGVGVSQRYLNALFDSEQQTVGRYLRERRVVLLLRGLRETRTGFDELAALTGFASADTARRALRDETGMTAAEVREDASPG